MALGREPNAVYIKWLRLSGLCADPYASDKLYKEGGIRKGGDP